MRFFQRPCAGCLRQVISQIAPPGQRDTIPPKAWIDVTKTIPHDLGAIFFKKPANKSAPPGVFPV